MMTMIIEHLLDFLSDTSENPDEIALSNDINE